ncbi:alpha-ribazole-5-phosphate synthase [Sporosarcina sp. BI001-red]|uniref:alpha-ribazole-5-phosphate synthase n=1 Tax=Sporosarcina sp. BI001-red TaxID=2282866 RepID=UPI000E22898C|nr:alpha-ribazole-5-phosphate synthase [Sporosarcina sp. BI001-red]REB05929.1 alpha-ribazole-5-phosphate synthase [Sporosarcina sp. BI001-red]
MTAYRNAIQLGDFIVTTDNSGGIGEKTDDLVAVPDRITARFATRVALLEQWAAGAEPEAVLLHNFSGDASWDRYCEGINDVFDEIGVDVPPISGSSETNMSLRQSAVAVTLMGKHIHKSSVSNGKWYTYGTPLVGEEVLTRETEIASLAILNEARRNGLFQRIWPVGSSGILAEWRTATVDPTRGITSPLDVTCSAGPSTVVLLQIESRKLADAKLHFGPLLHTLE